MTDERIGPAVWVGTKGKGGRVTYPYAVGKTRGRSVVESVTAELSPAGIPEGVFALGDGRGLASGLILPVRFFNSSGVPDRPPDSRLERLLATAGPDHVHIAWLVPEGAEFVVLLDAAVPQTAAESVFFATAVYTDLWLERNGLRPEEYYPGRWRGGFLVDRAADPLRLVDLPRATVSGVRRTTTVWSYPNVDIPAAEKLLRAAARVVVPPTITIPVATTERPSGLLGWILDPFQRRR